MFFLLIDLLGDEIGTCLAETISVMRPGETFGNLSKEGGDGYEFGDIRRFEEGYECLKEDKRPDCIGGEVAEDSLACYGSKGLMTGTDTYSFSSCPTSFKEFGLPAFAIMTSTFPYFSLTC